MDFQSAMETFAEAWVAANAKTGVLDSGPPTSHQVTKKKKIITCHEFKS